MPLLSSQSIKAQEFREPIVGLLLLSLFGSFVTSGESKTIGISMQSTNGSYLFSAGTSLWELALAALFALAYFLLMNAQPSTGVRPVETVLRRFVAFYLDLWFAIAVLGPILGIAPVLVESSMTGHFAWSFERTEYAPTDSLLTLLSMPVAIMSLLLYFAIPMIRRRPSPGACVVGYQVVPDDERTLTLRQAFGRTLWGFLAVCSALAAPFFGRDRTQGKIWIDKKFGTSAKWLE